MENSGINIIDKVDEIVKNAISIGASDIHIECEAKGARLRYRIDGILYDKERIPEDIKAQVVSRVKVLSNINLAEKRVPQDGKFLIKDKIVSKIVDKREGQKTIDLRVSTFPAIYGEKVVIRILDRSKNMIELSSLGFAKAMLDKFISLIERPSGFILVTGPTGSGKTTTLYAVLSHLNSPDKNIITLEDPVEYNLDGVTQGQIHPEAGFTFARGIRSVLRQDPDIAMIGEIRDKETAQIAIEAALTGHRVFSTLHTNDAPGAVMRLMDMNIEPFLINAAVSGVLAQRLARKICKNCIEKRIPDSHDRALMAKIGGDFAKEVDYLYYGKGCNNCLNTGYLGRTGVFELFLVSQGVRELVIENPKFDLIRSKAIYEGMQPMSLDGLGKVKQGVISLDELARVVA